MAAADVEWVLLGRRTVRNELLDGIGKEFMGNLGKQENLGGGFLPQFLRNSAN